jgi:RNA polymerase sigma factor (sigma-70 family)
MSVSAAELDALFRSHGPRVFRRARRLLGRDADAHEVVQDVFLGLVERPGQLELRDGVSAWFYTATTHACLNRLRNMRGRARILAARGQPSEADPQLEPDALVQLRDALAQLPPPLGEVAVYTFVDGMTQEEIAPLLGCSRRQVGVLIERVRAWGREQEARCSTR